ncbi:MAG TPA: hypothetical protein VK982_05685 [Bacteroidales bacterium]|nr:hypothetical protein [Bacteroidales bacterium]
MNKELLYYIDNFLKENEKMLFGFVENKEDIQLLSMSKEQAEVIDLWQDILTAVYVIDTETLKVEVVWNNKSGWVDNKMQQLDLDYEEYINKGL